MADNLIQCRKCKKFINETLSVCPYCATPRIGAKPKIGIVSRVIRILGVVFLCIFGLVLCDGYSNYKARMAKTTRPTADTLPATASPVITMAKYQRLQNGMSYAQAVSIIGVPGEETSRNHTDGVPGVMESIDTVMYQWMNGNGSNMNAMFQNDKLIQKAQFGLR